MTTVAKTTFGAELWLAPAGDTLVKVAELLSVEPPVMQRDTMDVTTHDSAGGAMEVIGDGVYDPGNIKGQVHYIAGSTGDDALRLALTGGAKQHYKIVVKSAADTEDLTGSAYLISYGPDGMEVKGKQTAAFELKASGAVAQAASA